MARVRKAAGPRVQVIEVHAASPVIIIRPEDKMWQDGEIPDAKGAFVWLRPPVDADFRHVLKALYDSGAKAVRVDVHARARVVTGHEEHVVMGHRTLRAIVEEMVEHAHTQDRAALRGLVEQCLVTAGL